MSLRDALRLCLLLAEDDRRRYERAAVRWLSRSAGDAEPGLTELQLAAVALATAPESDAAREALRRLAGGFRR